MDRLKGGDNKKLILNFDKLLAKVSKKPYQLPKHILNMLKEHTTGYILITLNNHGDLNYDEHFDNQLVGEAIENKTLQILTIKKQISDDTIYGHLNPSAPEEDDEGDEGENAK